MATRVKVEGIVLRVLDYGESDRIVTLLTRERGKVGAFARGARASRRRFAGLLEPFTLLAAELTDRRGDLLGLESASALRAHGGIRTDLARIAVAGYAVELAGALIRDAEPHPALFDLLAGYLAALDSAPAHPAALRAYELGALAATGFMPRLDACASCGSALPEGRPARLDPAHGGLLCPACEPVGGGGLPSLSPVTVAALLRLQSGGLAAAASEPLAPPAGRESREALTRFVENLLGRRLASRKFLDEVGPLLAPE
jgi:DNA repair protein RecO (recombination protein O)